MIVQAKTVIEVITREGTGTTEDPYREVTRYYLQDGKMIAELFDRHKGFEGYA
jgi:hypothetical protein